MEENGEEDGRETRTRVLAMIEDLSTEVMWATIAVSTMMNTMSGDRYAIRATTDAGAIAIGSSISRTRSTATSIGRIAPLCDRSTRARERERGRVFSFSRHSIVYLKQC